MNDFITKLINRKKNIIYGKKPINKLKFIKMKDLNFNKKIEKKEEDNNEIHKLNKLINNIFGDYLFIKVIYKKFIQELNKYNNLEEFEIFIKLMIGLNISPKIFFDEHYDSYFISIY